MKLRNLLLVVSLFLLTVFAIINWQAIMAPTDISLLFTKINAPLGLILIAITGLFILLFMGFVVYMQSSIIMSRQRLLRDLDAQRELANKAEASRFTDLQAFLQTNLMQLTEQGNSIHTKTETRLSALETSLKETVEQTGNSLSAYIGELEDRLENKAK